MKVYNSGRVLFLASALLLTACESNVEKAINPYVNESIALKADGDSSVFKGTIPFTETHYFTNYRTVCDTVQCGWDYRNVCETVPRCTGTHEVCRDVPDSVCHTDSSGQRVCTSTPRRECHQEQSCTNDTVCHQEQYPRYCQENCREVPFQDSRKISHASSVTVTVTGGAAKDIKDLVLGAKTNGAYTAIFHNASQKPADIEAVLKNLTETDKTLVVLKSKTLKLVDTSSILILPADFKAGDPVNFELKVTAGADKSGISAIGTAADLPVIRWTTSE